MTDDLPDLPQVDGAEREAISLWVKSRLEESERAHLDRIELLRTAGEHPSPIYARFVRLSGELGLTKSLTAKQLGISVSTLTTHYAEQYELGAAEILSAIAANMNRKAISNTDPAAAKVGMQILERRLGETYAPPTKKVELDNKRDLPNVIDSSRLTRDQRQQLRDMLTYAANGGEGEPIEPDEDGQVIP
jgi:AraC-like DNA-binding protein